MTGEPWRLVVAASAARTLERLPERVAAAIVEFMLGPLLESPQRVGKQLKRELAGIWSARRGPYRVLYEIDERAREVRVLDIDHRAARRPRSGSGSIASERLRSSVVCAAGAASATAARG